MLVTKSWGSITIRAGLLFLSLLLIAFVPLAKSQEAVVPAEVKVPITETTYFCYDKAVTGFNPPYDKSVDFKETKFTGQWHPVGKGDSAGFELKGENLPFSYGGKRQFFYCEREMSGSTYNCNGDNAISIYFDTASLRGVKASMGGYIHEGDSVAIGVFKCEEF